MNKPVLLSITLAAAAAFTCTAQASALRFDNPVEAQAVITKVAPGIAAGKQTKVVTLMNLHLSPAQKKRLMTFSKTSTASGQGLLANKLPSHIDLGMNGVPVLNQGRHGSCVTFATTAAFDALIGKGDYVSQLCILELGSTLENVAYTPSGWNGSWGPLVAQQLLNFGVVNKDNQVNKTCAGVTEYPLKDGADIGKPISLEDYKSMSEDISQQFSWFSLLSNFESNQWTRENDKDAEKTLDRVKSTLATRFNEGDDVRITFGIALPVNHCFAGACGTYRKQNDTWTLTDAIKYDTQPEYGGHEMVITGYDDNAVVTDNEGKQHKGLLMIRNSWGDDVGNNGTFYISYDYFKQYILEVQAIVSTHTPID